VQAGQRGHWQGVHFRSLLPTGWDEELIALHQRDQASRSRVCAAEAESMATALSRSPLHVCGGRLHAFKKLCSLLTPYISTEETSMTERCSLAQRAVGWLKG